MPTLLGNHDAGREAHGRANPLTICPGTELCQHVITRIQHETATASRRGRYTCVYPLRSLSFNGSAKLVNQNCLLFEVKNRIGTLVRLALRRCTSNVRRAKNPSDRHR